MTSGEADDDGVHDGDALSLFADVAEPLGVGDADGDDDDVPSASAAGVVDALALTLADIVDEAPQLEHTAQAASTANSSGVGGDATA